MTAPRILLPLLLGGIVTLAASQAAAECTCEADDANASLNAADIAFWGKGSINDDGEFVMRVSKSFKGTRRKRKHTVVPSEKCSYEFEEGEYYMVFASKAEERDIKVSACMATTKLPKAPYTATTWSAAEQLPYGASRRTVRSHQRDRERLNDRALDKVRYAARKCDSVWKKGKDKVSLLLKVRFDVQPNGKYEANVLEYKGSPDKDASEVQTCLTEKLDGKKFRKFSGNAVSVRTYWKIDRLDASMQQEKKSSVIKPYEGDGSELEEVSKKKDAKKKGG